MRSSLSKTEVVGLILLLLLASGITAAAFLMRDCSGKQPESTPVNVRVADSTLAVPDGKKGADDKENGSGKKRSTKGSGRKSASKKSGTSAGKKEKDAATRPDPFTDTIPMDDDYYEE